MNSLTQSENFAFPKAEKLCSRKRIDSLFETGLSFYVHPFKVYYCIYPNPENENPSVQVLFSIPKRNIKKAVDRNSLKRLIRECYRLQKHPLSANCNSHQVMMDTAFVYSLRKPLKYKEIHEIIFIILQRLNAVILQEPKSD